jgi:hypothetical protein
VLNQPGEVSHLSLRDENYLKSGYTDWMDGLRMTVEWYRARQ